jgi:hypothetical protein
VDRFKALVSESGAETVKELLIKAGFASATVQRVLAGKQTPGRRILGVLGLVSDPEPLGPVYESLEAFFGSVADPVVEVMRILDCTKNHAIGVVRGIKVPPKKLLDALGVKSTRRTVNTQPKTVLLARNRYLQRLGNELLKEVAEDSEAARAWNEAWAAWESSDRSVVR